MQRQQKHKSLRSKAIQVLSFTCILFLSLAFSSSDAIRVKTITFTAADGLEITADEYIVESTKPYILLFHEQGSSRGEFNNIARRFCKLEYNCLAVDLRNGGYNNFVSNQTARQLREEGLHAGIHEVEQDVEAAIQYIREKSTFPVILFGSGANGSVSLQVAVSNANVRAVVAMSPGEYFLPGIKIQDTITQLEKPVFITSSKAEFPYVSELASGIHEDYLTLFEPMLGEGDRGTRSLTEEYEQNTEYWIALILFFKDLM
ncbi:MAG: dienelactone hydrolase family protein [Bacteroidales bacterium]|nr:dienelactone hydrolase family protein [Bacteroidales bacterium]